MAPRAQPLRGRYLVGEEIARGGIASVHIGLARDGAEYGRPVAVKKLLPALARDHEFAATLLDEARLAGRVRHPNVVATLDVFSDDDQVMLVLEYIHGESLAGLVEAASRRGERMPIPVAAAIVVDALQGLHAAHEARDERGVPLEIVHRDVTPQNILVGVDGAARAIDFGIAKATSRGQTTREGQVKGKLAYLAPEQLRAHAVRASDVYGASACLWEAIAGRRLFEGDNESAVLAKILAGLAPPLGRHAPDVPAALEAVVMRALARDPGLRYATARDMAAAIREATALATAEEVGGWVRSLASEALGRRATHLADLRAEVERTRILIPRASLIAIVDASATAIASEDTRDVATIPMVVPPLAAIAAAPQVAAAQRGGFPLRIAAFGLAAAAIGAAVALAIVLPGTSTSSPAATAASAASAVSAARTTAAPTLASAPARSIELPELPAPTDEPGDPPPRATDLDALETASPPSVRPRPRQGTRARAQAPAPVPARPNCDPPYTLDAEGMRHYKRACFE